VVCCTPCGSHKPHVPNKRAADLYGYRCRPDTHSFIYIRTYVYQYVHQIDIFLHGHDAPNAVGLSLADRALTKANQQQLIQTRLSSRAGIAALAETLADLRHQTESGPCHTAADRPNPAYAELRIAPILTDGHFKPRASSLLTLRELKPCHFR
jgi:hypothetical protein